MAGSLVLRFCLVVQGQWGLMLCFSLRECMEATNSVSTDKHKGQKDAADIKDF